MDSDLSVFDIKPATHYRLYNRRGATGHKVFNAPNPPYGAVINYYLKDKSKDDVKVTVTGRDGKVIRELKGPKEAGLNRVVWDLRRQSPVQLEPGQQGGGGGGGGFFGGATRAARSSRRIHSHGRSRGQAGDQDRASRRRFAHSNQRS